MKQVMSLTNTKNKIRRVALAASGFVVAATTVGMGASASADSYSGYGGYGNSYSRYSSYYNNNYGGYGGYGNFNRNNFRRVFNPRLRVIVIVVFVPSRNCWQDSFGNVYGYGYNWGDNYGY